MHCSVFLPWLSKKQPRFGQADSENPCILNMRKLHVATRLYHGNSKAMKKLTLTSMSH